MLVQEFRKKLKRGLGSPLLHLINNVKKPQKKYVNTIVQACIQQTAYDPQVEMERTQYLYEVIQYSGFSSLIQKQVLDHLLFSEDEYNTQQMLRLAKRFADDGSNEAKEAIRKVFRYSQDWNCFIGAEELIYIDRLSGLHRVAEEIGKKIVEEDYYETDGIYDFAIEQLGVETVDQVFDSQSHNIYVKAYLNSVIDYKKKERGNRTHTNKSHTMKFASLL